MKVRITKRPVGYISLDGHPLTAWPPAGQVVDLPDEIAEDLIKGGNAEKVTAWSGHEWLWPWRRPLPEPVADMKVRIKVQPKGYVSFGGGPLSAWPSVGSVVELERGIAEDLIAGGFAEEAVEDPGIKTVRLKVKRSWPKVGAVIEVPESVAANLAAGGFVEVAMAAIESEV
jgi:hypothetical protein